MLHKHFIETHNRNKKRPPAAGERGSKNMVEMKVCAKYRLSAFSVEFLQYQYQDKNTTMYLLNPTKKGSRAPIVVMMKNLMNFALMKNTSWFVVG